jgi:hypothetical protein
MPVSPFSKLPTGRWLPLTGCWSQLTGQRLLALGVTCLAGCVFLNAPVALAVTLIGRAAVQIGSGQSALDKSLPLAAILLCYGGLASLAIVAQIDALLRCSASSWQIAAAVDAAIAVAALAATAHAALRR